MKSTEDFSQMKKTLAKKEPGTAGGRLNHGGGTAMNRKSCLMTMGLIMTLITLSACQAPAPASPEETRTPQASYRVITPEDLPGEEAPGWYGEHYRTYGVHVFSSSDLDHDYLLLAGGEMPTAGYSVVLTGVEENEDILRFMGEITAPKKDEALAQVLTYPSLLLEVTDPLGRGLEGAVDRREVASEILLYEDVMGKYVGAIDGGAVEVEILEPPFEGVFMALRLTEKTLDLPERVEEGRTLQVTIYENSLGQWILDDFTLPQEGRVLEGIYVGRIDGNFVEVETPEGFVVFAFSMEKANLLDEPLVDYSAVTLLYADQGGSHPAILEVKPAPAPLHKGEPLERVTGVYQGMAYVDVHRFSEVLYWFDESLLPMRQLKTGVAMTFDYFTDGHGRRVILHLAGGQDR